MTRDWSETARTAQRALGSNKYCWIGATIGIVSMVAFNWIHTVPPQNLHIHWWLRDVIQFDWLSSFGDLLSREVPGMLLFLLGTILAFVTFLSGIVQGLGIAWFLASYHPGNGISGWNTHFELGFYLALASVFIVLMGWGLRLSRGPVRMNISRLAALSPRLGLFAR